MVLVCPSVQYSCTCSCLWDAGTQPFAPQVFPWMWCIWGPCVLLCVLFVPLQGCWCFFSELLRNLEFFQFHSKTSKNIYLESYRDRGRERERKRQTFPQMARRPRARLMQSQELLPGSPMWVQGPKDLSHSLLSSQAISLELDQKWSTWDLNQCSRSSLLNSVAFFFGLY